MHCEAVAVVLLMRSAVLRLSSVVAGAVAVRDVSVQAVILGLSRHADVF